MNTLDRLLYFFGIVRKSQFDELRLVAEDLQTSWKEYQVSVDEYIASLTTQEKPKFKIIQGDKK